MEKRNFSTEMNRIVASARKLIGDSLKEGQIVKLIENEFDEDECLVDEVYDLPSAVNIGKYNDFTEYSILSVEKKDNQIILHVIERGGESTSRADLTFDYVDAENLCHLANLIQDLV